MAGSGAVAINGAALIITAATRIRDVHLVALDQTMALCCNTKVST